LAANATSHGKRRSRTSERTSTVVVVESIVAEAVVVVVVEAIVVEAIVVEAIVVVVVVGAVVAVDELLANPGVEPWGSACMVAELFVREAL